MATLAKPPVPTTPPAAPAADPAAVVVPELDQAVAVAPSQDPYELVKSAKASHALTAEMLLWAPVIKPDSIGPIMQAMDATVKEDWIPSKVRAQILKVLQDPANGHHLKADVQDYAGRLIEAEAAYHAKTARQPAAPVEPAPELTEFQRRQVAFIQRNTATGLPGAPAGLTPYTSIRGQPLTAFAEQAARLVVGPVPAPTPQWGAMTAAQADTSVAGFSRRLQSIAPGQPGRGLRGPQR